MNEVWILVAALAIIVVALVVGYITTRKRVAAYREMRRERARRLAAVYRR